MASLLEKIGIIEDLGVGDIQTDEEMTVVPLIGDDFGDIAGPDHLKFVRTTTYGTMVFSNDDNKPAIVPTNMMVRGSGAQDHAMSSSGVVLSKSNQKFTNACCIESSQGGYFSGQSFDTDILPVGLRRELLGDIVRYKNEYGKLWPYINKWLNGLQYTTSKGRAHLRDFFDSKIYQEKLEDFSASFEPVLNQIGAIILFNGTPVGLEIMPTSAHWMYYWKWLIRGCYAPELIRLKELKLISSSSIKLPDLPKEADPREVKDIITSYMTGLKNTVKPMLKNIEVKQHKQIRKDDDMITTLIRTAGGGGGDIILKGTTPVYYSIVL